MKNYAKPITLLLVTSLLMVSCTNLKKQDKEVIKEKTVDVTAEKEAVKKVMKKYKDAIQSLSTNGTLELFTKDALVFESGGVEGTFSNYLEHHLGPELHHFNSFVFSNYKADVSIDFPFAFVTETYVYTIDIKEDSKRKRPARIIKKKGVATSILKKIDGTWKIIKTHSSSRNVRKNTH